MSEVEVFTASLVPAEPLQALAALLSPDERARADRFAFPELRARFTVARAQLRRLLGRKLGRRPEALRFEYGPHGKPELEDGGELRFNLAHSGDVAIYALAVGGAVGVDVERVREIRDEAAIARRFFAAAEARALQALPPHARPAAFFTCWTRKEAYVKARGGGLSLDLGSFEVGVEPRGDACLIRVADAAPFVLRDVGAPPGYRAAVAAEGGTLTLRERTFA